MYKILRIFETLGRLLKKPTAGTGRRIAMSPFFKNVFQEEDEEENLIRQREYYNPHKLYERQLNYEMYQLEEQQRYVKKTNQGLTDLLLPINQSPQEQVAYLGDYKVNNNDNFLHSIQLNRKGAENHYFSLDDLQSVQSHYDQQMDFDMYCFQIQKGRELCLSTLKILIFNYIILYQYIMKRNKSINRKKKQEEEEISESQSEEEVEVKQKGRKSKSQNQRKSIKTRNRVKSENKKREQKQQEDFQNQIEEAKQKIKDQAEEENQKSIALKKEIIKGRAAVDEYFLLKNQFHVYQNGNKIYDCLLNQTNIVGANNNNKFYIAQVLESDATPYKYYFYTRWGRIGQKGQNGAKEYNLESCISEYEQKVYDKSISGDYRIIEKFYPKEAATQKSEQEQYDESTLHNKVKDLIKLMFDVKMMDRQMLEIGYDSSKMPLGKLGEKTIKQGYTILQSISKVLDDTKVKGTKKKEMLEVLSSEFFSYIPHNFGFARPPVISEKKEIRDKLEMLASLEAIEIATKLLEEQKGNKFEAHYSQLNSKISYVEPDSKTFEIIQEYLMTTHGKTHSNFKLKIQDVFEIDKAHQTTNFKDFGNRMLLWHGSRLTNFVGIISQGLRIAPPEAPCTGYMFGKGIYFADSVSKSANYCCANRNNTTALILLCDVSLGKWQELTKADYNANELPENHYSTKGVGRVAPSKSTEFNDAKVPLGPMEELNIKSDLIYNEYIVYDVNQVKLKYLIKIAFIY